jgi:hypothetical protein
MSSFKNPHRMYLFNMTTGKKKLAYGENPQDALEILSYRLSHEEMALIIDDEWVRISPRDIQAYVREIG